MGDWVWNSRQIGDAGGDAKKVLLGVFSSTTSSDVEPRRKKSRDVDFCTPAEGVANRSRYKERRAQPRLPPVMRCGIVWASPQPKKAMIWAS